MDDKPVDELKEAVEPNRPTCEQCMKEIPPSASRSAEAADYIHHFCGPKCYAEWQKKHEADRQPSKSN